MGASKSNAENTGSCTIKKFQSINCSKLGLTHEADVLAQINALHDTKRFKIHSIDLSRNPKLNGESIKKILERLPNLKKANLAGVDMKQVPPGLFKSTEKVNNVNISDNDIICARSCSRISSFSTV